MKEAEDLTVADEKIYGFDISHILDKPTTKLLVDLLRTQLESPDDANLGWLLQFQKDNKSIGNRVSKMWKSKERKTEILKSKIKKYKKLFSADEGKEKANRPGKKQIATDYLRRIFERQVARLKMVAYSES